VKSSSGGGSKPEGRYASLLSCGLATLVATLLFAFPVGPLQTAYLRVSDWIVEMTPKPDHGLEFGQILIDSASLGLDQLFPEEIEASPELTMMAEGWPWSRAVYAGAVRKLLESGAKLVILDILLDQPRAGDAELAQVIRDYPDQIVLVSNVAQDYSEHGQIARVSLPAEGLTDGTGAHVGFANFWADVDGVVRSAPYRLRMPGVGVILSSPATAISLLGGPEKLEQLPASSYFVPCIEGLAPDVRVPIYQLFSDAYWQSNLKSGEVFRDRIIAIGAAAARFHDQFRTPVGEYIGAGLHLSAIGSGWVGAFYQMPAASQVFLYCLLGGTVALGVCRLTPQALLRWGLLLLVGALMIGIAVFLLQVMRWMLPVFPFWFGMLAAGIAIVTTDAVNESMAKRRVRRVLERYVSPGVAGEILDNRAQFLQALGGARREVTVMFCDVRGFTSRSEKGEPVELFHDLNYYFGHMVGAILKHGGGVDKFLGDGILAVWGTLARRSAEDEAREALQCVGLMKEALHKLNDERSVAGKEPWRIGIGLHSGPVLFGNVGTEARMEPTIIGDTVNLASRVEGLTKSLRVDFLATRDTLSRGGDFEQYRSADLVRVVGRSQPVEVYTHWPQGVSGVWRGQYRKALAAFRSGNLSQAKEGFRELEKEVPGEPLVSVYRERCEQFLSEGLPAGWDGVVTSKSK